MILSMKRRLEFFFSFSPRYLLLWRSLEKKMKRKKKKEKGGGRLEVLRN